MNDFSFDLSTYLNENKILVEKSLENILKQFDPNRELVQAMEHSLMAGGKRLRPVLGLAAASAWGGNPLYALPACCAMEMIHTYSLIHDDLPAMDDDDLRRGVPTCHKKFSEATAILAGDGLLTHAFYILTKPELLFEFYPGKNILVRLVSIIANSAGVNGMLEGQMLDMQSQSFDGEKSRNQNILLDHLKKIHALKTGRMISASVEAGAISVGADLNALDSLMIYADNIGLAFQVMDDILNVEGDPKIMGKAAGSDVLHEKMTFPAIIGLGQSKEYARQLIDAAINSLEGFDEKANPLRAIASYIINRDR
ncbi:MAG: farnesyl-diphosphate synthase [Desulfobacteraceae bacterium 4572_89]|nr:MAG: farnesyl-diphosphate synthase [Desulfobacteraceae bacterium 4572_89]